MKERICWIGGSHNRHLYYINEIAEQFNVVGGVMQVREDMSPPVPEHLEEADIQNWNRHFKERDEAELKHFGKQPKPDIKLMKVDEGTLNEPETAEFIRNLNPDICLIFGTGMIREPLLSALPKETLNLHLGLSPRYRGAATLFWPFYFLEPNWAGTTFHYIVHSPDAGDIVHQVVPPLSKDDGIHDVAAKAVLQSTMEAVALLQMHEDKNWQTFTQKPEAGKNFLASDFKPQHLRMIYQEFDNDIVRAYLDGEIEAKPVRIRSQF